MKKDKQKDPISEFIKSNSKMWKYFMAQFLPKKPGTYDVDIDKNEYKDLYVDGK